MGFLQIFNNKKYTFISILLFLYVLLNLLDGERGLISYYDKKKIIQELNYEKSLLIAKIDTVEKKNSLLSEELDLDYLEFLYRKKFMVGKSNETIYNNN
tara:strand:+ start:10170 stop:10466 length:297 start_codon:yes stop_codon:yes gene_type:complete